jgi:hypothetical protein
MHVCESSYLKITEHQPRMQCLRSLYNQTSTLNLNAKVISMQQTLIFRYKEQPKEDDNFFATIQIPDFLHIAFRSNDSYKQAVELYPSLNQNDILFN